jgi:sulfur relay (sulfurtransferase) DsrC/TusE family protein
VDDEGYLENLEDRNETGMKILPAALEEREGMSHECPLTQEKIDILRFIREYYTKCTIPFPCLRRSVKISINRRIVPTTRFLTGLRHGKLPDFQKKPTTKVFAYLRHNP